MTARPYRSHENATVESFAKDPEYAAEYHKAVLKESDAAEQRVVVRRRSKASGDYYGDASS